MNYPPTAEPMRLNDNFHLKVIDFVMVIIWYCCAYLGVSSKRADVLRLKFRIEKSIKNFPSLFVCSAAIRFLITIVHILVLLFVQSLQVEHSFQSYSQYCQLYSPKGNFRLIVILFHLVLLVHRKGS